MAASRAKNIFELYLYLNYIHEFFKKIKPNSSAGNQATSNTACLGDGPSLMKAHRVETCRNFWPTPLFKIHVYIHVSKKE